MARFGFALEETQGLDDGIGKRPVELDDLPAGPPREFDLGHLPMSTVELSAKLVKCHSVSLVDLLASLLNGDEGVGIGEDLGGLFQGFILVDWDEHGGRATPTGDNDMLPQIGDLIDDLAELAPKLSDWDRLAHD
ncbi:MAG: hypothetical protein ABSH29_21490 [Acidimicrobiales bacterium]|jgi:hypothetical protein